MLRKLRLTFLFNVFKRFFFLPCRQSDVQPDRQAFLEVKYCPR